MHRPDVTPCDAEAERALRDGAALGAWFRTDAAPREDWTDWEALTGSGEPLRQRVAEVRALLADGPGRPRVEPRVAASLVHLGLVARLVSPVLGAALAGGVLPIVGTSGIRLHLAGANPLPLSLSGATAWTGPSGAALTAGFATEWVDGVVQPLSEAVARRYALSSRVLAGNVASAVAGGLRAVASSRPELRPAATDWLTALLADGPLARAGRVVTRGGFVRNSCCLFYRLPGAGTCADCVLGPR